MTIHLKSGKTIQVSNDIAKSIAENWKSYTTESQYICWTETDDLELMVNVSEIVCIGEDESEIDLPLPMMIILWSMFIILMVFMGLKLYEYFLILTK